VNLGRRAIRVVLADRIGPLRSIFFRDPPGRGYPASAFRASSAFL
jgi:hypothetical protein